jgi:hypothetical protein
MWDRYKELTTTNQIGTGRAVVNARTPSQTFFERCVELFVDAGHKFKEDIGAYPQLM